MENNKKNNYNKSYDKQNINNRQQEKDITRQMQEIDKKLKQKQEEINKELDRKQEEFNIKIEQAKIEIIKNLNNDIDEQVKTSISKKMREEEKKIIGNKNRKIITRDFIIILLIALIGFLGYCLYDLDFYNIKTIITNKEKIDNVIANNDLEKNENTIKEDNINNKEDKKEEKQEEVKTSKYYIENYKYLLDKIQLTGNNELYFYKSAVDKKEIPNNIKLQMAYKNLDSSKKKIENGTISFKAEDMLKTCKELLGDDVTINNEIFEYNNNRFLCFNDTYLGFLGKDEQVKSNVIYVIENAYEKDNELVFEIVAAKKQENKLVNIITEQPVIEEYKGEDILTYKNNLSQYKFVYSKAKDNYYFERVEMNGNIAVMPNTI